MESQTLKVVMITIALVVVIQLLLFYLRSIYIKYVTGFQPLFNPFERVTEWSNKDWLQGELYGRASTIQRYGLTKHCVQYSCDLDAVKEVEKWELNKKAWESIYESNPDQLPNS